MEWIKDFFLDSKLTCPITLRDYSKVYPARNVRLVRNFHSPEVVDVFVDMAPSFGLLCGRV
jgi:hypothetical protein